MEPDFHIESLANEIERLENLNKTYMKEQRTLIRENRLLRTNFAVLTSPLVIQWAATSNLKRSDDRMNDKASLILESFHAIKEVRGASVQEAACTGYSEAHETETHSVTPDM
ncbi:uncharacterized protein ATNIH1004_011646 [Aspergillus tanneri]|uniref:Uncharacterized protein n=1 Tax=Aspergillus tanneri TaxID=1220188 RepID=A0A5M9M7N7_9EURO|nr:uncharacterized protein ATNIH1004_011646 [Aspergillus tanneri]KAA8641510.1 hypothetical protein ATNIH1004_011646 [Aspergillus tanneri]